MRASDLSRFDLSGRTAVVTGGSRGLGKAMALGLARAGADVVLVGRNRETLEQAVREFRQQGLSAEGIPADVSEVNSIRELFRQVANLFEGKLDILINAAGMNIRKPATEYSEAEWDAILNTNLKGTFFCCQEAGRLMIPRRFGRIINIGSLTSSIGIATIAPYGATKMGVVALAKTLAVEWGPYNVTVNVIAPGWYETDLNRVLFRRPGWKEAVLERLPLQRTGEGEDLAGVAVFLASDAARYITGQVLTVDGGFLAGWHANLLD